jgi:hypothetical protein
MAVPTMSFTCPRCGFVSHSAKDEKYGYCGHCNAFTDDPLERAATGEYSVVQFFADETYEYVRRFVDGREAVEVARACIDSVAGRHGLVRRVIITDGGDLTNFEWRYHEGITFPEELRRD